MKTKERIRPVLKAIRSTVGWILLVYFVIMNACVFLAEMAGILDKVVI